jgi:hypothetical protein
MVFEILLTSWDLSPKRCYCFQSLKKAVSLPHPLQEDHLLSRSYLPSAAGQAAFYQVPTP